MLSAFDKQCLQYSVVQVRGLAARSTIFLVM